MSNYKIILLLITRYDLNGIKKIGDKVETLETKVEEMEESSRSLTKGMERLMNTIRARFARVYSSWQNWEPDEDFDSNGGGDIGVSEKRGFLDSLS